MANINVDPTSVIQFALRWIGAGLWGAIGWAVAMRYIIPHLPGL